jgi:DNA primase
MQHRRAIFDAFDVGAYVNENFDVVKPANNGELRVCCPHCGEREFKCYINETKKIFNCYKCDFHTGNFDLIDLVAKVEGITRGQATLRLTELATETTPLTIAEIIARIEQPREEDVPKAGIKTIEALPPEALRLANPLDPVELPFWTYLTQQRGLTIQEVLAAKVHYVPDEHVLVYNSKGKVVGNIGHRVVFPVYGPGGVLVSWLSRATGEPVGPKYVNCPETELSKTLWPFAAPKGARAVIVEGILDCLGVRRAKLPHSAYATFGKKISDDQVDRLKELGITEVILFWDPDAKKDTVRQIQKLRMHFKVLVPDFSTWPKDCDPGDALTREDGVLLVSNAVNNAIDTTSTAFVAWQIGAV